MPNKNRPQEGLCPRIDTRDHFGAPGPDIGLAFAATATRPPARHETGD